jgi:hypothetical protein
MWGCFSEKFQHQYSLDILCDTWLHTHHLWLDSTASVIVEMDLCLTLLGIFLFWFVSFWTSYITCELFSVVSIIFIHHHTTQIMVGLCASGKSSQLGCLIARSWKSLHYVLRAGTTTAGRSQWFYFINAKFCSLFTWLRENFILVSKMFTACDKTQQCCIFTFDIFFLWSKTQISTASKGMAVDWIIACPCKAIPLQAWTALKDSRRLRLPDFKTIGTWRW